MLVVLAGPAQVDALGRAGGDAVPLLRFLALARLAVQPNAPLDAQRRLGRR